MRQPIEEAILVVPDFLIGERPTSKSARRRWEVSVDGLSAKQRISFQIR